MCKKVRKKLTNPSEVGSTCISSVASLGVSSVAFGTCLGAQSAKPIQRQNNKTFFIFNFCEIKTH